MPRARWKIYYTDRSTLTNRDVERPRDIPQARRIGVHSVAQVMDDGRMRDVMCGSPYYAFLKTPRAWCPMEVNDVEDYETNLPGEIVVLLKGRVQTLEDYQRILVDARFDRDMIGYRRDPKNLTRTYEE